MATGYDKATSALMRKAIFGAYQDILLPRSGVAISKGGMPPLTGVTVSPDASWRYRVVLGQ